MFVRKKKNRSGNTSIVIVDKSRGFHQYVKTIGISSDLAEIEALCRQGQEWIYNNGGQQDLLMQ
jgi:hypothetical protein